MMSKNGEYKPGNPEYDYWNDKNLYPSLRHDKEYSQSQQSTGFDNSKVGFGSVFFAIFVWLAAFAPFAFFLNWKNWITQVIFWVGLVIVALLFIMWVYDAVEELKTKKDPPEKLEDDLDLPWYKKYPPADVIKEKKK